MDARASILVADDEETVRRSCIGSLGELRGDARSEQPRTEDDMDERASILVVDDDETVRRSCIRSLDELDCDARAAVNGEQALQAMEQRPFDVVLLDLRMPGAQGLEVLEAIKRRWPESEVVVITGYPTLESARQAMRLGACDYLAKPVGPDEVIDAARGAMRHKKWALRAETATVH